MLETYLISNFLSGILIYQFHKASGSKRLECKRLTVICTQTNYCKVRLCYMVQLNNIYATLFHLNFGTYSI
jgi:hypothetical protein